MKQCSNEVGFIAIILSFSSLSILGIFLMLFSEPVNFTARMFTCGFTLAMIGLVVFLSHSIYLAFVAKGRLAPL